MSAYLAGWSINVTPGLDTPLTIVIDNSGPHELEQATTHIIITDEEVTFEFYLDGEMTGKLGMEYDEWFLLQEKMSTGCD